MREFLGGIEGASSHASDWLDPIIAALASEGAHNVHDLAGAKFEDFDFSASSMNGAAKRLVRQAIALATAGQAAPPEPSGRGGEPSNGNAAAASAASAATAAIAEFLQKKEEAGHRSRRLRRASAAVSGDGPCGLVASLAEDGAGGFAPGPEAQVPACPCARQSASAVRRARAAPSRPTGCWLKPTNWQRNLAVLRIRLFTLT